MGWEVVLSNGERIKQDESRIESWRDLVARSRKENLSIISITYNGEDPHPDTRLESFFVIYDVHVPNIYKNINSVKIGIGGFYPGSNKCRIRWYKASGNPIIFTEIVHSAPAAYREFAINATKVNR